MNREDFQKLAQARLDDAKTLLSAGRFAGAYYLAGYSVECALKAAICRNMLAFEFPPRDAAKYYQHDLMKLVEIAELEDAFHRERTRDPRLATNWNIVKDWGENSRYRDFGADAELLAGSLIEAIIEEDHGVLECLSKFW